MPDLKTLQYPRHVHNGAQFLIVNSPAECDAALDDGWVLSPGDSPREAAGLPDATIAPLSDSTIQETPAEASPAPKTKGRPRKTTKE